MSRHPHDALFRAVFSQVEHAAGLLAALVPAAFAARVDWSSLAVHPSSFVDARLRPRCSDLLFSVTTCDGAAAFVYLLVEHQSEADRWMALRLHGYVHRIWEQWLRGHGGATRLPAVLPIVVHHGASGWTAPATLSELYDLNTETLEALAPHLPELRFLLDDLAHLADEALEDRPMTDVGRLALLFLQRVRLGRDLVADVRRWMHMLRRALHGPSGRWALELLGAYTLAVVESVPESLLAVLGEGLGTEGREAFMTAAEKLIEQGRAEGLSAAAKLIEQGRAEGLEKGRLEGRADVLLRLVAARFGAPARSITERVRAASADQIDQWTERILTASSLTDLFGED
jgi:hypothetical protein